MYERIVEIIIFLVSELKSNKQLNDIDVSFLAKSGYTQSEISTAFSWLFERIAQSQQPLQGEAGGEASHRVLSDGEKMVIEPEAFGYLLQCRQLGLLSNVDVETIIDRVLGAGFSGVGIAEMKSFVAGYLFDPENPSAHSGLISSTNDESIH